MHLLAMLFFLLSALRKWSPRIAWNVPPTLLVFLVFSLTLLSTVGLVASTDVCYTVVTRDGYRYGWGWDGWIGWDGGTLTITNAETNVAAATSTGPEEGCAYYPPEYTCERTETACLPCGSYSVWQAGSDYPSRVSWLIRDADGSTVAEASGMYSATFLGISACASCGIGSGAVSEMECETCPAGKYSDIDGAGPCTSCVAGTYSGIAGATSPAVCLQCEAGKASSIVGATSESTCSTCEVGKLNATKTGAASCDFKPASWEELKVAVDAKMRDPDNAMKVRGRGRG